MVERGYSAGSIVQQGQQVESGTRDTSPVPLTTVRKARRELLRFPELNQLQDSTRIVVVPPQVDNYERLAHSAVGL